METTTSATDRIGRIGALTTLSPVEQPAALRRRLAVIATVPGVGRPVVELSMIHRARWLVLDDVPHPDGSGRPWRLNSPYLLFDARFDGTEQEYLDLFSDILPLRLTKLFGACFGFDEAVETPGADGRVFAPARFREFVESQKLQHPLVLAAADPAHTVNEIRQALAIERVERRADGLEGAELDRAQREVESMALGAPPERPGVWEAAVAPFVRRAQRFAGRPLRVLAAPPDEDEDEEDEQRRRRRGEERRRRRLGAAQPLTVLAPLRGEEPDVGALREAGEHFLARLPHTHFARLLLVGPPLTDAGQRDPDVLPVPYLLFASDHDRSTDDYLDRVRRSAAAAGADELFAHCADYPGSDAPRAFRHWFERHARPTSYDVEGYPPRTVEELAELLRARRRIAGRWRDR